MSTGAAEVVTTKSVSSWADASNDQLCDNGVRNFTAVQEAFETTYSADAVPDDAAKGFGRSASLDAAAAEGAKPRGKTEEGVACPLQWLPVMLGANDPVPSGNRVVTTHDGGDVDDGTPHRDLTSHQPAEQPTPADIRSHAPPSSASFDPVRPLSSIAKGREMIAWWTSSALMCALLFLLSAYVSNGKVATFLLLRAACTPLRPAPCYTLHLAPRSRTLSTFHPGFRTMAAEPDA